MSRELEGQDGVRSHTTVVFADRGSTESAVTEDNCLFAACKSGDLEQVQLLVKQGTNPNTKHGLHKETPLIAGTKHCHLAVVKYLLESTEANINATDKRSLSACHYAAITDNPDMMEVLISFGADIHVKTKELRTACHWAASNGNLKLVQMLDFYGANMHLRDKNGSSPLDMAKDNRHASVVDYLESKQLSLHDSLSYTKAVQRAMREGVTEVIIIKALIIGPPGTGKTGIRYLLLGLPPPPKRTSTPIATRAARAISMYRLKADGSGIVTWKELDDNTYLDFIAEEVKLLELNPSRGVLHSSFAISDARSIAQQLTSRDQAASATRMNSMEESPITPSAINSSPSAGGQDIDHSLVSEGAVRNLVWRMALVSPGSTDQVQTKKTFIHLIDSGGQPTFISLVPAFVRGSTVNIVASKLNHRLSDKLPYEYVKDDQHLRQPTILEQTQLEAVEELVRTLSSVKHSKIGRATSSTKFLIVGTHADKHWSLFDETIGGKNRWLKQSLGNLKSMCVEVSPDGNIILPVNTRVKHGRAEVASSIRKKIIDACSGEGIKIPTRWYIYELELGSKAKRVGRSILGLDECKEVGKKLNMEVEVVPALVFLDKAGLFLYFQDVPLVVFTDPQAILNEVSELLNLGIIDLDLIPLLYPLLAKHMASVRKLREKGLFNRTLVELVCDKYRVNVKGKCMYTLDDFLTILKHLLIIAPVVIEGEEYFFLPSILPVNKKVPSFAGKLAPFLLLCRTKVMPLGMFSAIVVAMLDGAMFTLLEIYGRNAISLLCKNGGVVLLIEEHAWLVVHFNGDPSFAPQIRGTIHSAVKEVCNQRQLDTEQIVFTNGFWCPFKPKCECVPHPCEVNLSTGWLTCTIKPSIGSDKCIDENMLAWTAPEGPCDDHPSAETNMPISGDSEEVSLFLFMEHVASKILSKWRRVGIALELDMSMLDAIEDQRRGRAFDCFSEVYKYWRQQSSPERPANWASIVAALRSQSVGEERLADVIEATFMH